MTKALFCGSRDWFEEWPIEHALKKLPEGSTVIHGDARGADRIAGRLASALGFEVQAFPADWSKGLSAGPVRSQRMLDEGNPDVVYAFPTSESRGTWDMVRRARKAGIPVEVYR